MKECPKCKCRFDVPGITSCLNGCPGTLTDVTEATPLAVDGLSRVKTYHHDRALFKELGLQPFDLPCGELKNVGTIRRKEGSVEVFVIGLPSLFWTFEIKPATGKAVVLETGSGGLGKYWPVVEMLLDRTLTVTEVKP